MNNRKIVMTSGVIIIVGLFLVIYFVFQYFGSPDGMNKLMAFIKGGTYLGREGVVMQTGEYDCGPCALKMVFDHYNIPSSIEIMKHDLLISKKGASMLAIKQFAEGMGLKSEGLHLSFDELIGRPAPMILFVHSDHFIVADSVVGHIIYLRDPSVGRMTMCNSNLQDVWSGETLLFSMN